MASITSLANSNSKLGVIGIVKYSFSGEQEGELSANAGEHIKICAHVDLEWFLAKPIGRLEGPGFIPVSYIQLYDVANNLLVSKDDEMAFVQDAGIPDLETWKKNVIKHEIAAISLADSIAADDNGASQGTSPQQGTPATQEQSSRGHVIKKCESKPRLSLVSEEAQTIIRAAVEDCSFTKGRYWYFISCEFNDGTRRTLWRYYQDFYDLQINLLQRFPKESLQREDTPLPRIPGPCTSFNETVARQRRIDLDCYIKKLISAPNYISNSDVVLDWFKPREGDEKGRLCLDGGGIASQRSSNQSDISYRSGRSSSTLSTKTSMSSLASTPVESPQGESWSSLNSKMRKGSLPRTSLRSSSSRRNGRDYMKVKVHRAGDIFALKASMDSSLNVIASKIYEKLGADNLTLMYRNNSQELSYLFDDDSLKDAIKVDKRQRITLVIYAYDSEESDSEETT